MGSDEQVYLYAFAERLKNLRNERSISQNDLAEEIDVSEQTIRRFERAEAVPNLIHLHKLSNYFDVTISYLAGSDIYEDYDLMTIKNKVDEIKDYIESKEIESTENPLLQNKFLNFLINDFKNNGFLK